jgi:hypothetical protein
MQALAERAPEAFVAVGEGLCLRGERVAPTLVPGDQRIADVEDGHADLARAVIASEVFSGGEQLAPELLLLQMRRDGEHSQVPDPILLRLQPDACGRLG